MNKDQKSQVVAQLAEHIATTPHLYIADTTGLNAEQTNKLRRLCFRRNVKLIVVKNTLLKRALATKDVDYSELHPALKGTSAIMLSQSNNEPAKLIKEFGIAVDKFKLKGAYVEESFYLGHAMLDTLVSIKSKNELIGDVLAMLQSPMQNVIGALNSGGNTIAGVLKTLEEKKAA
jgi:large subunit ribosomal protein L10